MRLYLYSPDGGYVSHEYVMPEPMWREVAGRGLDPTHEDATPIGREGSVALTRAQLEATDPAALAAWEARDDRAMQAYAESLSLYPEITAAGE